MNPDTRSYGIAAVALLCVLAGVATIGTVLANVPSEPRGDGMVTFFAAIVLAEVLLLTLFALLEAALLAGLVRWTDLRWRPRHLLEAGALAGGLAVPLRWATLEAGPEAIPLAGSGIAEGLPALLAGVGLTSAGLGTVAAVAGPLSKTDGRLLGGALLVVLAGAVVGDLPASEGVASAATGSGTLYAAVGLYALVLAGLLAVATTTRPDAAHWLALPPALAGVFVAVLAFLTESFRLGTLAGLSAVVTLWAFWTLAPRGWSALEESDRGTDSTS